MVARRGFSRHVIYDDGMRRRTPLLIGALAFAGAAVGSGAYDARAQMNDTPDPTSTTMKTTTTSPPMTIGSTTTTQPAPATTAKPTTTTTAKGATTTTLRTGGAPIPPPASGASQPLDPSLLGGVGPIDLDPSTTVPFFTTENEITSTTSVFADDNAISVSNSSDGPSGATLALASVAWLASLGGLLVYAEDQRSKQWRHLAR